MMNRTERSKTAQETLDIFQCGYYLFGGKQIDCQSRFSVEFLSDNRLKAISPASGSFAPKYAIVNESVVDTVVRFGGKHCGVLNFASAKNPGGAFSKAQLHKKKPLPPVATFTIHNCNRMSFMTSTEVAGLRFTRIT